MNALQPSLCPVRKFSIKFEIVVRNVRVRQFLKLIKFRIRSKNQIFSTNLLILTTLFCGRNQNNYSVPLYFYVSPWRLVKTINKTYLSSNYNLYTLSMVIKFLYVYLYLLLLFTFGPNRNTSHNYLLIGLFFFARTPTPFYLTNLFRSSY